MDRHAARRLLLLLLCVGSGMSTQQMALPAGNRLESDREQAMEHYLNFFTININRRSCDSDASELNGDFASLKMGLCLHRVNLLEVLSHEFSDQDSLQRNGQHYEGGMKPELNVTQVAIAQVVSYNLSREGQWEGAPWRLFSHSHHSPLNVTVNGIPCILFWAKRIMIRLENHTQLDLTEKTFGVHATVDLGDSNCSEDTAMLSLKFGDIGNLKGLVIRFLLTSSYYQLSVQSWFSLQRLQLLYNHSVQATFNATRIHAPASYSYHCEHVSSLQRYDALLIPSSANDLSKLWEVTFIDFQIQGFNIQEGHFAYAKDCASFSPAILMGLVMSLVLLLVLAYALHMLIHLKSLDRHYECKASPAYFPQMKDSDMGDEKEPLRNSGIESYELRNQQFGKIYI